MAHNMFLSLLSVCLCMVYTLLVSQLCNHSPHHPHHLAAGAPLKVYEIHVCDYHSESSSKLARETFKQWHKINKTVTFPIL
jgi:hypothetical protein